VLEWIFSEEGILTVGEYIIVESGVEEAERAVKIGGVGCSVMSGENRFVTNNQLETNTRMKHKKERETMGRF
jgi:hypothetical protein